MKKIVLLSIMLFLSALNTFGQKTNLPLQTKGNAGEIATTDASSSQTYLPVLVEGRLWKLSYAEGGIPPNIIPDAYMTITVDGDSIVNGKTCKKLLVDYSRLIPVVYPQYIVAYEKDGRVYRIDEDGKEHLVMDINPHRGDLIYIEDEWECTVVIEDFVIVDGMRRKRLVIDSHVDNGKEECVYYMVEGIGLNKDEFVDMGLRGYDWNRYHHRLLACYDNGKCIFSAEDFTRDINTGITNSPKAVDTDAHLYDMQGKKRSNITKGEIYIHNGKKHVRR